MFLGRHLTLTVSLSIHVYLMDINKFNVGGQGNPEGGVQILFFFLLLFFFLFYCFAQTQETIPHTTVLKTILLTI